MAEVRVTSIIILVVIVGAIGFLVLTFGGWFAVGWFNKKNFDDTLAGAKGYKAAKTPTEALDKFREAIQARQYRIAGDKYCTKAYAELLSRSHDNASELGADIDRIREFASSKDLGLMTDKTAFFLNSLDPFPKNFKVGPAAKEDKDGKTAVGTFVWEPVAYKNLDFKITPDELKSVEGRMYQNVLAKRLVLAPAIKLVKEGEDWKLDIPTSPEWDAEITYFNDRSKSYHTALKVFIRDMGNERYGTAGGFEADVMAKLREIKQ